MFAYISAGGLLIGSCIMFVISGHRLDQYKASRGIQHLLYTAKAYWDIARVMLAIGALVFVFYIKQLQGYDNEQQLLSAVIMFVLAMGITKVCWIMLPKSRLAQNDSSANR